MEFQNDIEQLSIRFAGPEDIPRILCSIRALAEYEQRPQDVLATEAGLAHCLFEQKLAEVLLADYAGEPAGYALFYPTFASFSAAGSLYLEDLFIYPHLRGKGLGKSLLRQVAAVALQRGYHGMQWSCLDWNQSSIDFYHSIGAVLEENRVHFEFKEESMQDFVASGGILM